MDDTKTFTGDLDKAIQYFEMAKHTNEFEDPTVPYLSLGQVYLMKGHLHQARAEVEEAQRMDPDNPEIPAILDSIARSLN